MKYAALRLSEGQPRDYNTTPARMGINASMLAEYRPPMDPPGQPEVPPPAQPEQTPPPAQPNPTWGPTDPPAPPDQPEPGFPEQPPDIEPAA